MIPRLPEDGLLLVADCENLASLCPAPGKDFAAVFSGHPRPEAMFVRPFAPMGLVGSFHVIAPFSFDFSIAQQCKTISAVKQIVLLPGGAFLVAI